jgi:hypothetical protein
MEQKLNLSLYNKKYLVKYTKFDKTCGKYLIKRVDTFYEDKKQDEDILDIINLTKIHIDFIVAIYCYLTNSVKIKEIYKSDLDIKIWNKNLKKSVLLKFCDTEYDKTQFNCSSKYDIVVFIQINYPNIKIYSFSYSLLNKTIINKTTFAQKCIDNNKPIFSVIKKIIIPNDIKPIFDDKIKNIHKYHNKIYHDDYSDDSCSSDSE